MRPRHKKKEEEEEEEGWKYIVTVPVLINILCMEITHVQPPLIRCGRAPVNTFRLPDAGAFALRLQPVHYFALDQWLPFSSVFVIRNRWLEDAEVVSPLSSLAGYSLPSSFAFVIV